MRGLLVKGMGDPHLERRGCGMTRSVRACKLQEPCEQSGEPLLPPTWQPQVTEVKVTVEGMFSAVAVLLPSSGWGQKCCPNPAVPRTGRYQAPNARVDLERGAAAGLIVFYWSHTEHDGGTESLGKALSLVGAPSQACRCGADYLATSLGPRQLPQCPESLTQ